VGTDAVWRLVQVLSGGRTWLVHLGLFAVIASWAVNQILTKSILGAVSPLAFLGVRFIGLDALAVLVLVRGHSAWTRRDVVLAAAAGVGGFFFNQLGFALGLSQTTVFSTSLLIATSPIFALLGLALWRLERVRPRQWLGVAVAFAGIALFLSDGARLGLGPGDLLSLMAGLTFACLNVFNKPVLQRHGSGEVLAVNLLSGGLPLLLLCGSAMAHQPWRAVPAADWAAIAYTVVIPVFAGYQVWNWAVKQVGVGRTIAYANLTPLLAGVLSAVVFAETFDLGKLVGAAACLVGLALAAGRGRARSEPASAGVGVAEVVGRQAVQ